MNTNTADTGSIMLRGVNALALDGKGRCSVPAKYRALLQDYCQGQLVITIDTEERCLLVYPLPQWERIQAKIEALPSFNAPARRIQRLLLGHATDVDMDSSGRVLLSGPLRDYAQLDKKAVLLGQGNKFELWDEALWQQLRDEYVNQAADAVLPDEWQQLSL